MTNALLLSVAFRVPFFGFEELGELAAQGAYAHTRVPLTA